MKNQFLLAADRVGLGMLVLFLAACQPAQDRNSSSNAAGAGNAIAGAGAPSTAPPPPTAAQNEQRQAQDVAVKAASDATGPVALPTDNALPQSCQAYVRAVQACINRSGGSDVLARNRVQTLRRALQTHRMQTWPAWQQSDYLERGCVQQTEGLSTMTEGC